FPVPFISGTGVAHSGTKFGKKLNIAHVALATHSGMALISAMVMCPCPRAARPAAILPSLSHGQAQGRWQPTNKNRKKQVAVNNQNKKQEHMPAVSKIVVCSPSSKKIHQK